MTWLLGATLGLGLLLAVSPWTGAGVAYAISG